MKVGDKNTYFAYFAYFVIIKYLIINKIKAQIFRSCLLRLTSPYFDLLRLLRLTSLKTAFTSLFDVLIYWHSDNYISINERSKRSK